MHRFLTYPLQVSALVCVLFASSSLAQDAGRALAGCWKAGEAPVARACFSASGVGMFMLVWDAGRCAGDAAITGNEGSMIKWEVPRQEGACLQGGVAERMVRRSYTCAVEGRSIRCREVIYLDDGSIWMDNPNVVFNAQ